MALTIDLNTPQEYFNMYNGELGMLTISFDGVLHRVGRVLTKFNQTFALVLCKELGYDFGIKIRGPWKEIDDGDYSIMESWCHVSTGQSVINCSRISDERSTDWMEVDFFVCSWKTGNTGVYRCVHADFSRRSMNGCICAYRVLARAVL